MIEQLTGHDELDPRLEAYLDEVDAHLPFVREVSDAVLHEIEGHLEDTRDDLVDSGIAPDVAAHEAVRRLGSARDLARNVTKAHQTRRRLVTATGAGMVTLVGQGLMTLLVAGLVTMAAYLPLQLVGLIRPFDANRSPFGLVLLIAAGLFAAGRTVPATLAHVSRRPLGRIRHVVAVVGLAVMVPSVLVLFPGQYDAAAVAGALAIPLVFVAGVYSGDEERRMAWTRSFLLSIAVISAIAWLTGQGDASPRDPVEDRPNWTSESTGLSAVGRPELALVDEGGLGFSCCPLKSRALFWDLTVPARFSDIRFEAWPAEVHASGIDPTSGPAWVVNAVQRPDPEPERSGNIDHAYYDTSASYHATRSPIDVWLVVTGMAQDGSRSVLTEPNFLTLTFNGTTADWLSAPWTIPQVQPTAAPTMSAPPN